MKYLVKNPTVCFLEWMVAFYGSTFQRSYRQIASDTQSINFMTVKYHIMKLEKLGVITIDNKGTMKQVFHISLEKAKRVMN